MFMTARAFIFKDYKLDIRYPFFFFFRFFEILTVTSIAYYSSKYIKFPLNFSHIDYFSYLLIGLAFFSIFRSGLYSYSEELIRSIHTGSMESFQFLPVCESQIIVLGGLWKQIIQLVRIFFYFLTAVFLFNAEFIWNDFNSVLLNLMFSVLCFSGLGLISASILIFLKKAEPVNWMISQIFLLTGGVLFPVEVLPISLKNVTYVNPVYYSLNIFRTLLLRDQNTTFVREQMFFFGCISFLVFATGFLLLSFSVKVAKKKGILCLF